MNTGHQLGTALVDQTALAELCRRYGVRELSVFGSAARGEMTESSDLDILVEFEPSARIGIIRFQDLSDELAALTGHKIDLVTKQGLKPAVRPHVLKDARILYAA